jgi:hypothetical protein
MVLTDLWIQKMTNFELRQLRQALFYPQLQVEAFTLVLGYQNVEVLVSLYDQMGESHLVARQLGLLQMEYVTPSCLIFGLRLRQIVQITNSELEAVFRLS